MDLSKAFLNEEPIGGLEIASEAIRFVLLKKDHAGLEITTLAEEKLLDKEGLISEASFIDKLSKFTKKNKIKYVIISIPTSDVFVKTYTFPSAMPDEKITDSMKLTVDLQLPKKKEEIYCDWMWTEKNETEKKVLLSYILKTKADILLNSLKRAGLKVVAVESRAMSLARTIKQAKNVALLAIEKEKNSYSFSVLMNNNVIFSYSAPNEKIGNNLEKEVKKIINYYSWFNIDLKNLLLVGDFTTQKIKKLPLESTTVQTTEKISPVQKDLKWLIPLGAASRGIISRKNDKLISLMNIGTETAYKREKANSTANFFVGTTIALSLFFLTAFIATWSLVTIIQNNYIKQISSFNLLPSSENTNVLKEKAAIFNNLVDETSALIKKEAHWSVAMEEIKNKAVSDVVINNLTLPDINGIFSVTGVAANREAINNLKKSFESSNLFGDISLPLDNLGKKTDIPFSLSFKIKNSALVYGN